MTKQFRVIDASISKEKALEILAKHNLYAEQYCVAQGADSELAEAMRLLSGLGCVIKHNESNLVAGRFERLDVIDLNAVIHSTPRMGMSCFGESTVISENVIQVHFPENSKSKFSFKDAIRER